MNTCVCSRRRMMDQELNIQICTMCFMICRCRGKIQFWVSTSIYGQRFQQLVNVWNFCNGNEGLRFPYEKWIHFGIMETKVNVTTCKDLSSVTVWNLKFNSQRKNFVVYGMKRCVTCIVHIAWKDIQNSDFAKVAGTISTA